MSVSQVYLRLAAGADISQTVCLDGIHLHESFLAETRATNGGNTKLRKATHTESVISAATPAWSVRIQGISEMVIGRVKPQK